MCYKSFKTKPYIPYFVVSAILFFPTSLEGSHFEITSEKAKQTIEGAMQEMEMYGIENLTLQQLKERSLSKITLEDTKNIASLRNTINEYLYEGSSISLDEKELKKSLKKEYISLRKLYKSYALLYHPDKQKACDRKVLEEKFARIVGAMEVLTKKLPENLNNACVDLLYDKECFTKIVRGMFRMPLEDFLYGDNWLGGISLEVKLNQIPLFEEPTQEMKQATYSKEDMLGPSNDIYQEEIDSLYERDRQLEQEEFELRNEEMRQKSRIKKEAMEALLDVKKIKFEEEKRQHAAKMDLQKQLRALNREKVEYEIQLEEEKIKKRLVKNKVQGFQKVLDYYLRLYKDEQTHAKKKKLRVISEREPRFEYALDGTITGVQPGKVEVDNANRDCILQ